MSSVSDAKALPSLEIRFVQTFKNDVLKRHPGMKLILKKNQNENYMGGSRPIDGRYEISIGRKTMIRLGADATLLILCHELGHLLGGSPYKNNSVWPRPLKPSTEAQSDFYATRYCAKKFYRQNPDLTLNLMGSTDLEILNQKCRAVHETTREILICRQVALASLDLLMGIWSLMNVSELTKPSYSFAAKNLLPGQESLYPTLQCRLDILLAGNLIQPRPNCY